MDDLWQNPVVMKVHGGTLPSTTNLCLTCSHAHHIQSGRSGHEVIRCMASHPALTLREPVARCTQYYDKTKPSLQAMQEVAWIVMTDKGGRKLGFLSPEEIRGRDNSPHPPIGF